MKKVAVVLLNYNSNSDLYISTSQILTQKGVDLITIIVDNNSSEDEVVELVDWYKNNMADQLIVEKDNLFDLMDEEINFSNRNFLILNSENRGYSAGNNIGIKFADYIGVDAVLIVNPDMRFEDNDYIKHLVDILYMRDNYYIVASRVLGLDGKEQNPLRETTFLEEFCWFCNFIKKEDYILDYDRNEISIVPKICGCCFMVKMSFLRDINLFDEGVFLYSEEPILAKQVKNMGGEIVFTPFKRAIHAHQSSKKGNSSNRMKIFIKSRIYYILNYSGYSFLKKLSLILSYQLLYIAHSFRYFFKR